MAFANSGYSKWIRIQVYQSRGMLLEWKVDDVRASNTQTVFPTRHWWSRKLWRPEAKHLNHNPLQSWASSAAVFDIKKQKTISRGLKTTIYCNLKVQESFNLETGVKRYSFFFFNSNVSITQLNRWLGWDSQSPTLSAWKVRV